MAVNVAPKQFQFEIYFIIIFSVPEAVADPGFPKGDANLVGGR